MCTHRRYVTNRYTGARFLVNCGKCKSCLQEKAASRSNRIRSEYDGTTPIYFVTLTYDRLSAPYFTQENLDRIKRDRIGRIDIYRRFSVKWSVNKQRYIKDWHDTLLESVHVDCSLLCDRDFRAPWLSKQPGKIGVAYFRDVQLFNKRLRQVLKRNGYKEKIRMFSSTEYGETTNRPHAHLLIFAPNSSTEEIHNACIKAWPYGRRIRYSKSCQLVTDDPAGYVSSYVNSSSGFSSFLAKYFKAKYSASKRFGHGRPSFSLQEIKKKIEEGNLMWSCERIIDGVRIKSDFPYPKYVLNRFFPLFKGYSRLASSEVSEFLSRGFDIEYLAQHALKYDLNVSRYKIDYQPLQAIPSPGKDGSIRFKRKPSDFKAIFVRFSNVFKYFRSVFPGFSYFDYAKLYQRAWTLYRSTNYKNLMTDTSVNDFYKYDNIAELPVAQQQQFHKLVGNGCKFIIDYNELPPIVNKTAKMSYMYDRYDKQKKVSSCVLNEMGFLV